VSTARRSAAFAVALLLAGCGGQGAPGSHALRQEADALRSLAAEGAIVAADAGGGRSTNTFVRIHAAALTKTARASKALLSKGRGTEARRLAALAARVADRLDRLSLSGSDRAEQRRIATELERAAAHASRLAKRL
jgi:hypothetical protein